MDADKSAAFIERQAKVSETLEFDASASFSPQGGKLLFRWYQYKEVGSVYPIVSPRNPSRLFRLSLTIDFVQPMEVPNFDMHGMAETPRLRVTMPDKTEHVANDRMEHANGRVFHIILEVTSDDTYPLT